MYTNRFWQYGLEYRWIMTMLIRLKTLGHLLMSINQRGSAIAPHLSITVLTPNVTYLPFP